MGAPDETTYRRVAFWALGLLAAGLGVAVLLPFLAPILWASVLAILAHPIYARVRRVLRQPDVSALATILLTLVLVCLPLLAVGTIATAQLGEAARSLQGRGAGEALAGVERTLSPFASRVGIADLDLAALLQSNRETLVRAAEGFAAKAVVGLGTTLFNLTVALFAMFFFLRDGASWTPTAVRLSGLGDERAREILARVKGTVVGVFLGTIAVAVLQGIILGTTFALTGVPGALLLGVLVVVMGFVPVLGAPAVYVPAGVILLARGQPGAGLVVLLVGGLVASQVDNVLRPIFVGNSVSLHSLAVFLFILGGVALFGPVGVMAGPMALALLVGMRDLLLEGREAP